jgi:DNA-binding CsgD family transcriptional regulator
MERVILSLHDSGVVGDDDSTLLQSVIQALPLAAAILDDRGCVVVMNGRYQRRHAEGTAGNEGLLSVGLGPSGYRLLVEKDPDARSARFDEVVARYGLTRREAEVLSLLMEGLASRTIAARLELGVRTVESHVARLLQKSDAESRSELIARVFQSMHGAPRR